MERHERAIGCLLGLAIGENLALARAPANPLAAPRSGSHAPQLSPVADLPEPPHSSALRKGDWGANTAFALCLCDHLLERPTAGGGDAALLERYWQCWRDGEHARARQLSNLPAATAQVLAAVPAGEVGWRTLAQQNSQGTDAIARVAPLALRFAADPTAAGQHAAANARLTHDHDIVKECSRIFAVWLTAAINGSYHPHTRSSPLSQFGPALRLPEDPGHPAVAALRGALTVADESDSVLGALDTVYAWGNADELVLVGAIAGATYGLNGIPVQWREQIAEGRRIAEAAVRLVTT